MTELNNQMAKMKKTKSLFHFISLYRGYKKKTLIMATLQKDTVAYNVTSSFFNLPVFFSFSRLFYFSF